MLVRIKHLRGYKISGSGAICCDSPLPKKVMGKADPVRCFLGADAELYAQLLRIRNSSHGRSLASATSVQSAIQRRSRRSAGCGDNRGISYSLSKLRFDKSSRASLRMQGAHKRQRRLECGLLKVRFPHENSNANFSKSYYER